MENVEKKPKSTKNTNAKDVEKKVSTSKAIKANATTQEKAVKSNASKQSASKRGAKTEPKQTDEVVKGQEVAVDTADVERNSSSDDFSIQSQGERIKKNAGKNSKRKKAAIATAVVLLVTASVAIPTAVYLSRRKVSVDIANNIDIIQEYTINVNRGSTIKDIVPQEIKGYTFVGFYKDAELTVPYKDTDKINKNMTIYAKYEANVYKVTFPTSPAFTIEGEDIVNNQVEIEYNTEYRFKLNLATGYNESDITVKVNGETVTPDQDGYYTLTIYGDTLVEVEGVEINTYEVTFYDSLEKNEIYQRLDIDYNELCTYTGVTPTKHSTHTYTYTFIGWVDAEGNEVDLSTTRIVTDLELFANFREEYIEYTISKPEQVNVKFGDLYLSNTATLHYGDIVEITYDTTEGHDVTAFSVSGAEKVEGSENQYRITGNLVVTYSEEIQTFTVQIESSNSEYGSINQSSITVDYGTEITVSGNTLTIGEYTITATPTADDPTYDYVFVNWTNAVSEVTGDMTITANFERTMDEYVVSIVVNNASYGTVNKASVIVNYNTPITVDGNKLTINGQEIIATATASDAQYTYTFTGWTNATDPITEDREITATFSRETNTYTVTWKNWDGSTLETDTSVPYGTTPEYNGETPTREETASHSYTFTGWDQELNPVTGDITYTAVFDTEIKASYDFTIEDGIITSYTGNDTYVVLPSTYSLADMVETRSATLTFEDLSNFDGTDFANAPMALKLMYLGGFYFTPNGGKRTFYNNFREFELAYPNGPTDESLFPMQIDGATYEISLNGMDDGQEAIGYAFESIQYAMGMAERLGKPFNITFDDGTALENQTSAEQAMTQVSMIMEQKAQELTAQNPDITQEELFDQIYRFKFTTAPFSTALVVPGDDYELIGIGAGAFSNNEYIESITIPNTITNITPGFVSNCINLQSLIVEDGNPVYHSDGNAIIETESKTLILGCKGTIIPSDGSVTSIGNHAFYRCAGLTSITIPESVTSIGVGAFEGCTQLSSVTFENTENWFFVESIDSEYGIRVSAEDLSNSGVIAEYLTSTYSSYYLVNGDLVAMLPFTIVDGVVTGYTGRANAIDIPSIYSVAQDGTIIVGTDHTVTGIGTSAFSDETTVTSITIPASVTSIGVGAFKGCTQLSSVTFENTENWFVVDSLDLDYGIRISAEEFSDPSLIATYLTSTYNSRYFINGDLRDALVLPFTIQNGVITGYTGTSADVVIPSTYSLNANNEIVEGTAYTVTVIGANAFSGNTTITSITIPESVTSIGNSAFYKCSSLTEINFNATNMSDLSYNDNYVFYNAGKYGEGITVNIGANVTRIPAYLFRPDHFASYSPKITTVNFAESSQCTSIGRNAFDGCSSLTSITIPESVTSIGWHAFNGCSSLTSVTIKENSQLTSIGQAAFIYCSSLISITIPESVTIIEGVAFNGCSSLENIIVDEGNTVYHSDGNCLIETGSKTLIAGCKTSIIPSDGSVTSIGDDAFNNCTSLESITIPDSVTSIGDDVFEGCSSLTSVTIGDGVTSIGEWAFYGCSSLTSVTIGEGVTNIGDDAFYNCSSLTDVYYLGDINDWVSISFRDGRANPLCYGANLYINGNELVTEANIDTATSINSYAFYSYDKLTSVTIGDQVTSIGGSAFEDCSSLTSITIPDSVTSIGRSAFNGCSSLTSVTIGEGVTSIGDYAFSRCSSLTGITIPDSVTSIGRNAFYDCSSLTSVTIESNYAYKSATSTSACGYLLRYATEVRVLISCIGDSTNSYLEDTATFTKTTSEDELYYIYTKN